MEEQLGNPELNVDQLVSYFSLSRTNFFHKLKSLTGMAPIMYIKEIRMRKAAELIKENQYTIQTQILNQPDLCCPLREYTGIIPEQFRSEPCLICPKYQAKNGCEGMNYENQIFYLDENGNLIY